MQVARVAELPHSDETIHLVMGVSNAGKSAYVQSRIAIGDWSGLPVVMAYELEGPGAGLPDGPCVIHYNLFRPFENSARNLGRDLLSDEVLVKVLRERRRIRAYLLVAHRSHLAKRCLLRKGTEPTLRETPLENPKTEIFELLCRLDDLRAFHERWIGLLSDHAVPFELIDSTDTEFRELPSADEALGIFDLAPRLEYSQEEVAYILDTNRFEYQQISLDAGGFCETEGSDRSPMLRYLDADLSGKSVLDIGCAYGFFCFEAERRNAKRVVGTELKPHRFIGANIVKEILGKRSRFLYRDIFSEPLGETFDLVLLLNVLHHLPEPVKALRAAAQWCNEKLILEFPTLGDPKFQKTLSGGSEFDPALPLIGVSSLPEQDQTFVFSGEAVRRILMDHDKLFDRIEFADSPSVLGRMVAICHKARRSA